MISGFNPQCAPAYRLLSGSQIERIHQATLELLSSTGVKVLDEEARAMLGRAGCRLKDDHVVQIPNHVVEACIRSAPSRITIYNRRGEVAMRLEGRRVHYGLGTDLIETCDLTTGELRPSRLQDVANAARTADHFDEIDFIGSFALPYDAPTNLMYIDSFKAELENSVKPIFYTAAGLEDIAVINRMAAAVMGGEEVLREKPIHIHYAEPLSPLQHSGGAIRKLFFCADKGIPVNYTPGMMSGATGPVTLAGAIVTANAEALSGVVLHQLRAEGAPIVSGFGISTMDMATTTCVYGCPEYRLALSACADLYHHYGIPMWGTAGISDAHRLDAQAGFEAAVSLLLAGLDGANLVHDVGYLGQGLVGSPAALVMNAEIISYVKRLLRGFSIDDEHLGLETIDAVGPGGDFLSSEQTMTYFRQEHWRPMQVNRLDLKPWKDMGSPDYTAKATQQAREILASHTPTPLAAGVQERLDDLRARALTDLGDKRFEA